MKVQVYKAALSLALSSIVTLLCVAGPVAADTSVSNTHYASFDSSWLTHHQSHAENVVSHGAIPLITWMPYKQATPDVNIFKAIIEGKQDRYIKSWLADFKNWLDSYPMEHKPTIALRFANQLKGKNYSWGSEPKVIKAAWRYLHKEFVKAGVSGSVDWVWGANTNGYPGDDVVDWLSISDEKLYNTVTTKYPKKLVMLVNVQSASSITEDNKAQWRKNARYLINDDFPAIQSIAWLNTQKKLGWTYSFTDQPALAADDKAMSRKIFTDTQDRLTTDYASNQYVEKVSTKRMNQKKMPQVVGSDILAKEAEGIRKMDKAILRKWRLEGILPQ